MTRTAARLTLAVALLLPIGGLVVAVLASPREVGILPPGLGVAHLGVYFLLAGPDLTTAFMPVFAGTFTVVADLIRLLIRAVILASA